MVHALQKIHGLLEPHGGFLIDIHPRAIPRPLTVRIDHAEYMIDRLVDDVRFTHYQQADSALEDVVKGDLYRLEAADPFLFQVYFDTSAELTEYLQQNDTGKDPLPCPFLNPALIGRVEACLSLPGDPKQIILQRPVMMRKYRPIHA